MSRTHVIALNRTFTLDARADRLDLRDRPFTPRLANLPAEFPSRALVKKHLPDYLKLSAGRILDQGSEGACTGFGMAAVVNYLLWARAGDGAAVSPRMLYHLAKFYNEWPGEDYSGSSCRGALKGWHKHGVCARELWPYTVDARTKRVPAFEPPKDGWDADAVKRPLGVYYRIDKNSVVDMQAALAEIGAIYCSADVHDGWNIPAGGKKFTGYGDLPVIPFQARPSGGHAFALVGYTARGFVVQNSWGRGWGLSGFAILTYEDWVTHGTDAWTVSLGVAIERMSILAAARSPAAFLGASGGLAGHVTGAGGQLADAPTEKPYWQPRDEGAARQRMVVMGNNGSPINRLVDCADAAHAIRRVTLENALSFFSGNAAAARSKTKRLVLFVHGGLNSEMDSVARTRILVPYFEANGLYPLVITWKTGAGEIIRDILDDHAQALADDHGFSAGVLDRIRDALAEAWDRAVEVLAQTFGAKSIWTEMKQNAMLGARNGAALAETVAQVGALRDAVEAGGDTFELHVVGHSAGSIVLGHCLELFAPNNLKVATCSLYAPACTVEFANAHYIAAVSDRKIIAKDKLFIDVLSDNREMDDTVGPYRKSLLHLVSRALEDMHKMPVLGLLKAFDPACNHDEHWNEPRIEEIKGGLETWQKFWWGDGALAGDFYRTGEGRPDSRLGVIDSEQVDSGARQIRAVHGCFDNCVDIVETTLRRILADGGAPAPPRADWNLDY